MTENDKELLIKEYVKCYNSKDIDGMLKCVIEDVVFRNVAGGVVQMEVYGVTSLRELADKTKDLFRTREQGIKKISFQGDLVRVDISFDAEFGIDLPNGVKAGDKMSVEGYTEFTFTDGLLSSISDCS